MSDNKHRNGGRREAVKRGVTVLAAFLLVTAATLAWFTSARQVEASLLSLRAVEVSGVSAAIYHREIDEQGQESWRRITDLVCSKFLPNQSETYKIVLENRSTSDYRVNVDFLHLTAEGLEPVGGNLELCKVLHLRSLTASPGAEAGETLAGDGSFYQLYTDAKPDDPLNRSFPFAKALLLTALSTRELRFDITMPGDTPNDYQGMAIRIESISVQVSDSAMGG